MATAIVHPPKVISLELHLSVPEAQALKALLQNRPLPESPVMAHVRETIFNALTVAGVQL